VLASVWAQAFAQNVQTQVVTPSSGLEQYITATPTQVQDLTVRRSISLSYYLLVGAIVFLALFVLVILFFDFKR
jgi:hypothetical protein